MDSLESRRDFVQQLDEYINETKLKLDAIIKTLGWSKDKVNEKGHVNLARCKFESNHKVSQERLAEHEERCSWIAEGYTPNSLKEATPSSKFFYQSSNAIFSIKIDESIQDKIVGAQIYNKDGKKIVARTPDRATVELTPAKRLAVYDYVVNESKSHVKREEITVDQLREISNDYGKKKDSSGPKSRLEILAEQRDYKRRRQSYRAKNVHITKRSYTEVMREVISSQVKSWEDYLKEEQKESFDNRSRDRSRSPSRESHRNRNSKHSIKDRLSPHRHHSRSRSRDRREESYHKNDSRRGSQSSKERRRSRSRERRYIRSRSSSSRSRSSTDQDDRSHYKGEYSVKRDERSDRSSDEVKGRKHGKHKKKKKSKHKKRSRKD